MSALIWSVFADRQQARNVSTVLLEEKLIVCANLSGDIESLFLWQGKIGAQTECGALFKTDRALLKPAIARLEDLHPYETPAIFGWECGEVGDATAIWLGELTGNQDPMGNSRT